MRGSVKGYEYKTETDSANALREATTRECELLLVGKTNHEIFNIPQWLPPNIKVDIKLTLAPSNFILRKELSISPVVTVSLISTILNIRK